MPYIIPKTTMPTPTAAAGNAVAAAIATPMPELDDEAFEPAFLVAFAPPPLRVAAALLKLAPRWLALDCKLVLAAPVAVLASDDSRATSEDAIPSSLEASAVAFMVLFMPAIEENWEAKAPVVAFSSEASVELRATAILEALTEGAAVVWC